MKVKPVVLVFFTMLVLVFFTMFNVAIHHFYLTQGQFNPSSTTTEQELAHTSFDFYGVPEGSAQNIPPTEAENDDDHIKRIRNRDGYGGEGDGKHLGECLFYK